MNSQKSKNVMSIKKVIRRQNESLQGNDCIPVLNYNNSQSVYGDHEDYLSNASIDVSQNMRAFHNSKEKRKHVERQVVTSIIENNCFINSQLEEEVKSEHQKFSKNSHTKFQQFGSCSTNDTIRPHVIKDGKVNGYQYAKAPPTLFLKRKPNFEQNEEEFNHVSNHEFRPRGEVYNLTANHSCPENMSTHQMINHYRQNDGFSGRVHSCQN